MKTVLCYFHEADFTSDVIDHSYGLICILSSSSFLWFTFLMVAEYRLYLKLHKEVVLNSNDFL